MKTNCLKCGKYKKCNDSGYCDKCYNKVFKEGKYTTVEQGKRSNIIRMSVIILILIILAIGVYVLYGNDVNNIISVIFEPNTNISTAETNNNDTNFSDILNTKITADNYNTLSELYSGDTENEQDVENALYFSYACMYYIMTDGFTQEYLTTQDENLLYQHIYGKTINELIKEGKQLMKDNNITIEEYKQSLEDLSNIE